MRWELTHWPTFLYLNWLLRNNIIPYIFICGFVVEMPQASPLSILIINYGHNFVSLEGSSDIAVEQNLSAIFLPALSRGMSATWTYISSTSYPSTARRTVQLSTTTNISYHYKARWNWSISYPSSSLPVLLLDLPRRQDRPPYLNYTCQRVRRLLL